MLEQESDKQLASRIHAGDETALALLYDRYATAVMGVAWRVLQNRAEAEDIVSGCFLARLAKCKPISSSAWLLQKLAAANCSQSSD